MGIGDIWNLIAMQPVVNILIVLSSYLFSNFGLAVIALTIIIRGCMYPLTLKQLRASKAMQVLQPKLAEGLQALLGTGCKAARMTGSGSNLFGLCETEAAAAEAAEQLDKKIWSSISVGSFIG